MVALAVCSGVINTSLILGRLPLDWSQPYQLLLSAKICLVGAMVGISMIVFAKMNKNKPIPFGPYLALGGLIWMFFGEALVSWYTALLNP